MKNNFYNSLIFGKENDDTKTHFPLQMFFFAFAMTFCFSCSSDRDGDGVIDKNDKCPDVYAKTKDGCPFKAKEISNIHFYIETSASMAGYFNGDAEFKTIISDLTSKIHQKIKSIDIWFSGDSLIKYQNSPLSFSSDIATTRIASGRSSQLHKIINMLASKHESNDITIFVSDCILSFPDEAIINNPEINRTEAPNSLKNTIFSTFSNLRVHGLATSVYAFTSKFYGTYYDYQNGKKSLQGNKRPFYIWIIADKDLLTKFDSDLSDISTFKPEKSMHFGLTEEAVAKYGIIPQIERQGNWMKNGNGIKDIKLKKNETIQFCIGLSLESLPPYAKDIKYLQEHLTLELVGCEVEFIVKDKSKVDKGKLKSEPQLKLFEQASHMIVFKVNSMSLSKAMINVTLPLIYDNWYINWSCMDDKDISKVQNRTFAFEHLMAGVIEAYETKNKNYINFSINLNK